MRSLILHIYCALAAMAVCLGCNARQDGIFPRTFLKTCEPVITNPGVLAPVFEKLHSGEITRIVHIGDSHVRGHSFSVETRHILEQAWGSQAVEPQVINYKTTALATETGRPGIVYHAIGKNGATYHTFLDESWLQQIDSLHPDLVIISLGTNDAYGRRFDSKSMQANMDSLCTSIQKRNPTAKILLTTPPGCYWHRIPLRHMKDVAAAQRQYAAEHGIAVFDLHTTVGGEIFALRNWRSQHMMRRDLIHFSHSGYQLMGALLAQAILAADETYKKENNI